MQHRIEGMLEFKKPRDRKNLLNNPPVKETKLKTAQTKDGKVPMSLTGAPITEHTKPGEFDAPRIHGADG